MRWTTAATTVNLEMGKNHTVGHRGRAQESPLDPLQEPRGEKLLGLGKV